MLHSCNVGVILVCRYYVKMFSCMSDWLLSQVNCSSGEVVVSVMEVIDRFTRPFIANYNCSVVPRATTPRAFRYFLVY